MNPAGDGSRGEVAFALEVLIGRLLVIGTWMAMLLILVGVVLMLTSAVDPLAHGVVPPFDASLIIPEMLALRPLGFLWAGILLIIALPIGRVIVAGVGFLAAGDTRLALVSLGVFLVVVVSILAALGLAG
jgi:uncharacterized membrane protein